MCELFALSSHIPTAVTFSLKTFAARGGQGGPLDGWGIAYHDGRDARLYKEPEPARDSAWLSFIEGQKRSSNLVLSHMRHATQGAISLANTQPFARELGGRMHIFAHNGKLSVLSLTAETASARFLPLGETDSEIAFCILLERLAQEWTGSSVPTIEARHAVVHRFAADMRVLGPANFVYTDGEILFAHGHRRTQSGGSIAPPGLWRLHRQCAVDPASLREAGVSIGSDPDPQEITLFASVPLTAEPWIPFAEGELIAVRGGCPLAGS
jgi:predicted glutamine amidotransferase